MAKQRFTKDILLEKLKDYYLKYGYPTVREFDKHKEYPNSFCYRKHFGSLAKACAECGFFPSEDKQWLFNRKEYSEEELLRYLQIETDKKLQQELFLLTTEDVDAIKEMPSMTAYYNKFQSLKEAYLKIGIDYDAFNEERLKEDMKNKYRELKVILGRPPHSRDFDRFSKEDSAYYGASTYTTYFNSMHDLHILMGDKPTYWSKSLSDEELLQGLKLLHNELGVVPTQKDVELSEHCGSIASYCRRFGSFSEALLRVNLQTRSSNSILITPKGNRALSGYEYKFILMLEKYNINFTKEVLYRKYIVDFNKLYRFDFVINFNNDVYFVEIFGMTGNKEYDKRIQEKMKLCKANNLKLISLFGADIGNNNIDEIYKLMVAKVHEFDTQKIWIG